MSMALLIDLQSSFLLPPWHHNTSCPRSKHRHCMKKRKFIPLFLNAPRAERKQKRKEILWDTVNAISPVGIDNTTLLKLETVSKVIFGIGWMLI